MINSHCDRYYMNNAFNVELCTLKYPGHCFNPTTKILWLVCTLKGITAANYT